MKEQLAAMTIIELVRTAHSYATSIQQIDTYSAVVTEMASRLDALNVAYIIATSNMRNAAGERIQPRPFLNQAIADIIAERQRQISEKGFSETRDDKYLPGVLNLAGAAYAVHASYLPDAKRRADRLWPWPDAGKYLNANSKDPRSALIKAAALITAEIERIDRAQLRNGEAV